MEMKNTAAETWSFQYTGKCILLQSRNKRAQSHVLGFDYNSLI